MDRREALTHLIYSSHAVGRYLMPGQNLDFVGSPEIDIEADLVSFLSRLGDEEAESVRLLSSAYWLSQPDLASFIQDEIPRMLRHLRHGIRQSAPSMESSFKGRVLWQETFLGRFSGSVERGKYLVLHAERSADIPENQLLKFFLERLERELAAMARRSGGPLPIRFAKLRKSVLASLSDPYLHEVTSSRQVSARMLSTASRHRDWRYSKLVFFCRDFESVITHGKWPQIISLLQKGWLAPVSTDDLFELYALILVLQCLQEDLGFGEPNRYGLIQSGRASVGSFQHPLLDVEADVFFDQAPGSIFERRSEYLDVTQSHYGLNAVERRPDITVRFKTPAGERRIFIEAKETSDPKYTRDSIYKALGYLRDFNGLWDGHSEQIPKVVLLLPTGIYPKSLKMNDLVIVSSDKTEDLARAMFSSIVESID